MLMSQSSRLHHTAAAAVLVVAALIALACAGTDDTYAPAPPTPPSPAETPTAPAPAPAARQQQPAPAPDPPPTDLSPDPTPPDPEWAVTATELQVVQAPLPDSARLLTTQTCTRCESAIADLVSENAAGTEELIYEHVALLSRAVSPGGQHIAFLRCAEPCVLTKSVLVTTAALVVSHDFGRTWTEFPLEPAVWLTLAITADGRVTVGRLASRPDRTVVIDQRVTYPEGRRETVDITMPIAYREPFVLGEDASGHVWSYALSSNATRPHPSVLLRDGEPIIDLDPLWITGAAFDPARSRIAVTVTCWSFLTKRSCPNALRGGAHLIVYDLRGTVLESYAVPRPGIEGRPDYLTMPVWLPDGDILVTWSEGAAWLPGLLSPATRTLTLFEPHASHPQQQFRQVRAASFLLPSP